MLPRTRNPTSEESAYVEAAAKALWDLEHGDGFMSWEEIASPLPELGWPREAESWRRKARAAVAGILNADGGLSFLDCHTGHLMPSGLRLPCPYCIQAAWFAVNDLAALLDMATERRLFEAWRGGGHIHG